MKQRPDYCCGDWTCTIPLAPVSMKNNYRIILSGNRRAIKLTPEAEAIKNTFVVFMRSAGRGGPIGKDDKLRAVFLIRYPNYRRDVDVALIMDALQDARIIDNDRQIREITAIAQDQTGDPETQIRLERIGQLPWRIK